jgi:hypothetical protein
MKLPHLPQPKYTLVISRKLRGFRGGVYRISACWQTFGYMIAVPLLTTLTDRWDGHAVKIARCCGARRVIEPDKAPACGLLQ